MTACRYPGLEILQQQPSEKMAFLGIMWAQLRATLKILQKSKHYSTERFKGGPESDPRYTERQTDDVNLYSLDSIKGMERNLIWVGIFSTVAYRLSVIIFDANLYIRY